MLWQDFPRDPNCNTPRYAHAQIYGVKLIKRYFRLYCKKILSLNNLGIAYLFQKWWTIMPWLGEIPCHYSILRFYGDGSSGFVYLERVPVNITPLLPYGTLPYCNTGAVLYCTVINVSDTAYVQKDVQIIQNVKWTYGTGLVASRFGYKVPVIRLFVLGNPLPFWGKKTRHR
jgi:hypothetical protein